MSDKNKNENKNVIEKLLDSVITYSQSNMGPNEQILTQIATSPDWEIHGVKSCIDTAKNEEKVVQRAVNDLSNPKVFAGKTASAAADYGRSIVNIQYAQKLEDQMDAIEKRIKSANKVLEYVRNNQDNLPGNKLDDASSFAIRAAAVGATIFLPVSLPVGAAVAGGVTIGIASGWLDPVAKINDLLEKNREAEAKKLLEEEVIPMFKRLNSTESVPSAVSKPGDVQDIGSTDVDIWDQSGVGGRVPGPGTYLGDGAYDLNGDGLPDYYDYNMDGVPDVWVDSDGDGIPDIYDMYDPNDAAQNRKYAEDRRAGKQGRAWQVLQQRIDMGQTCERDIIMGLDTSAEAREVRAQAAKALDAMRTAVSELPEDDSTAQQLRQLRERQQSR